MKKSTFSKYIFQSGRCYNPALVIYLFISALFSGCFSEEKPKQPVENLKLKFINEYVIPYNMQFDSTTVGGLSGIDYDTKNDLYYSISDDRSQKNPVRFYTYQIHISDKIDSVSFAGVHFLHNAEGAYFPKGTQTTAAVDPEAMRLWKNDLIWSSEGERRVNKNGQVLLNPQVFLSDKDGHYKDTFQLPDQMRVSDQDWGIRQNGAFEGLDISPDGKYLYVSVEEPLLQDGPRAGLGDSTGVVRIIKYDLKTRRPVAQYAYQIDAVAYPVFPPNAFRLNGISDIKCLGNDKLMVVERSFSFGRLSCTIRVYIADLAVADDVSKFESLKGKDYRVAPKKLVINMDDLKMFIDNIEGVTFGPALPNGHRSVIFVADNNFNILEKSQLLLFKLEE